MLVSSDRTKPSTFTSPPSTNPVPNSFIWLLSSKLPLSVKSTVFRVNSGVVTFVTLKIFVQTLPSVDNSNVVPDPVPFFGNAINSSFLGS